MPVEYLEYIQQSDSSGLESFPSTPGNLNQDLDVSVNNSNEIISELLESNDLSQTIVIENIINQAEIDEYNSVCKSVTDYVLIVLTSVLFSES